MLNVLLQTKEYLDTLKPNLVYSGSDLGFDTIVIEQCLEMKIPFHQFEYILKISLWDQF